MITSEVYSLVYSFMVIIFYILFIFFAWVLGILYIIIMLIGMEYDYNEYIFLLHMVNLKHLCDKTRTVFPWML